jgi:hypothetical protein
MAKKGSRTPRNYDGVQPTSHRITDLLPRVLSKIGSVYQDRPDLIFAAWPEIMGARLASMTTPDTFENGVLTVRVKNSTLYSLLKTKERPRLLKSLRQRFPRTQIKNIAFRIG